jgi:hypothetical protein
MFGRVLETAHVVPLATASGKRMQNAQVERAREKFFPHSPPVYLPIDKRCSQHSGKHGKYLAASLACWLWNFLNPHGDRVFLSLTSTFA